jgi:hypothetical protein
MGADGKNFVPCSNAMWVLHGAHRTQANRIVPLLYKGRTTMWFSTEADGRAFIESQFAMKYSDPRLVRVAGWDALLKLAQDLGAEGVEDVFIDILPSGGHPARSLRKLIEELRAASEGRGDAAMP